MPHKIWTAITATLVLGACKTAPKPEPIPEPITPPPVITSPPVDTCTPVSALQRIELPAETEVYYVITSIQNPPYEPIKRKTKKTRVIKEAEIVFVDSNNRIVTDVCDIEIAPDAPAVSDTESVTPQSELK